MFHDILHIEFQGRAPSMSWKSGSDLRVIVNDLEIILARASVFRGSRLHTNVFHQCDFHQCEFHQVLKCLSRALMVIGKRSVPRCPAWQNLAGLVQSLGWWWRRDFRMKRNRSPDAQIRILGLGLGDCGSSIHQKHTLGSLSFWCEF